MKRLQTIFFLAAVFCSTTIATFAQNVTYLDENYKPATAGNYTYKRVIKYKEPIVNLNIGTGYYGGITVNPQASGLHFCSLIDYYNTGEPALIGNRVAGDIGCSQLGGFDGQVVAYYKNGNIKRKEPWKAGKLQGSVVFYNDDGTEKNRAEYENGKLIEEAKFAAPADSPLIGTWKHAEYSEGINTTYIKIPPSVKSSITVTYYQNGILEATFQNSLSTTKEKRNWKYIPKTSTFGVSEEYQGDDLLERGNVRWINSNQFEYTVTFHQNANSVGHQLMFTRQ